jgi:putative ABC transport system substrate-binding protein
VREVRRRKFLFATGALIAAPLTVAQEPQKVYRVGIMFAGSKGTEATKLALESFHKGMRERGWTEGRHYVVEPRWADGRPGRYPEHADDLLRSKVDLIVTIFAAPAFAVKEKTRTIPVVIVAAPDPVRLGLVASYARPGGNVTGITSDAGPTAFIKPLDFLKQIVPGLARIAVLTSEANPTVPTIMENLRVAAAPFGLELVSVGVKEAAEFESAFARMKEARAQALFVVVDGVMVLNVVRIGELALKYRLPSASQWSGTADAGGLLAYGADPNDLWRRSAAYVDKILKGANPADLPIEQPSKFDLVINLRTARSLGLTVPQAVRVLAERVIE